MRPMSVTPRRTHFPKRELEAVERVAVTAEVARGAATEVVMEAAREAAATEGAVAAGMEAAAKAAAVAERRRPRHPRCSARR